MEDPDERSAHRVHGSAFASASRSCLGVSADSDERAASATSESVGICDVILDQPRLRLAATTQSQRVLLESPLEAPALGRRSYVPSFEPGEDLAR